MRKIKFLIEYDGTAYNGWQFQLNGRSIQETLENKLEKITKVKTRVIGSGRTDAGVHALGQVAHFVTSSRMTGRQFMKAMNSLLPPDIVIKAASEVEPDFHAQISAVFKWYRYIAINRDYPSALSCRFAEYKATPLKLAPMKRAVKDLLGKQDFTSFRGSGCTARTSVRTLLEASIKKEGDFYIFDFYGDGFLKYMVRIIVGTLLDIGHGYYKPSETKRILHSLDRKKAGPTAASRGLTLMHVEYESPFESSRETLKNLQRVGAFGIKSSTDLII